MTDEINLRRKRGGIKARLTSFSKYLETIKSKIQQMEKLSEVEHMTLVDRTTRFENLIHEFDDVQIEIELAATDIDNEYKEREEFESLYYTTLSEAKVIKTNNEPVIKERLSPVASGVVNNISRGGTDVGIRLPTIQLPKFSGQYHNWLEYRDTYESLIHNNEDINTIQKFHYLRASLDGNAAQVIKSIEFCAQNYSVAWATLEERFNNTTLLIHNHIKSLFDIEPIQKESAFKIRKLIDDISKNLRSLEQLGQPVQHWDTLIVYMIVSKLDSNSIRDWEKYKDDRRDDKDGKNMPSLGMLKSFLKSRADLLETLESKNVDRKFSRQTSGSSRSFVTSNANCIVCKKDHYITNCPEFSKLTFEERQARIKELKVCFNCLKFGHFTKVCRSKPCKWCNKKHHSLLHVKSDIKSDVDNEIKENNETTDKKITLSTCNRFSKAVLLSIAMLHIRDKNGKVWTARALLDCGSQSSFISEDLRERLNLEKTDIKLSVIALNNTNLQIKYKCKTRIESMHGTFWREINFLIVPQITGHIPNVPVDITGLNIPRNIILADPSFHKPGKIDILLGADIFWSIIRAEKKSLGSHKPVLHNTELGWLVSGPVEIADIGSDPVHCSFLCNNDLQQSLTRFWELEEIFPKNRFSDDEQKCEDHYLKHTKRDETGRFVVSLPFKTSLNKLGDSYNQAERRFLALEKRLENNPMLKNIYSEFINEYLQLGHMSLVENDDNAKYVYFMPHHGVLRENSLTTKLRVVFDASAPTSSGYSLNNLMLNGPTIQCDLFSILLRFRKYAVVVAADIEKMYRQVMINASDRSLQRIIWRNEKSGKLCKFNLNTVTYATTAAPFLAIRSLVQVAYDNEKLYPRAAQIIKNDFYVDDMLTGFDNIKTAESVCQDIVHVLKCSGFNLRKFYSNKSNVFNNMQVDSTNNKNMFVHFSSNENAKTLGIIWCPNDDILRYNVSSDIMNVQKAISKRVILSIISQIFDPLGLIGPCIILVKIMLQKLWLEKLSWDDPIPDNLKNDWLKFSEQLTMLNEIRIKRHVSEENVVSNEIHGFSDASLYAYGVCIFLKTINELGGTQVHLLCAKSKVAPLKTVTIPKLELCAALMLSRLLYKVNESLKLNVDAITLWSDSTIVLSWLKKQPNSLKTFVGNRVSEIQELTGNIQWRYVSSNENPADVISRGVSPSEIINLKKWWFGPTWLAKTESEWPKFEYKTVTELPERRKLVQCLNLTDGNGFRYENYSSLARLQRVVAYILRFKFNCENKTNKYKGFLTTVELNESLSRLIKLSQNRAFLDEIQCLQRKIPIKIKSRLIALNPFLDNNGLLRVGGRLDNSEFNFEKKHPLIIDKKDHLTKLIFENEHRRLLHAGPQLLLSNVRDKYWPLSGRNIARKTVHNCIKCYRMSPKVSQPIMGNLPRERLETNSPFSVTGTDYAGPFMIKNKKGRGCRTSKCYVCIFVCFSIKAIHIELVTELSKNAFILALRRFVARRGKPIKIFSDNGTNFVAANKELKDLITFLNCNKHELQETIAGEGIDWEFIPPHSPHFGGLWEAGVKSIKYHLKRVVGVKLLTFEEFYTLLVQIESVVNSRPLSPLSSDPQDLTPLTPAHFLIGRLLTSIPEKNYKDISENRLSCYQHIQKIRQHFWERWQKEYISELQVRHKWQQHQSELKDNTLVLVKEDNLPPMKWRLGRIVSVHPGKDGINRVAVIKIQDGTIKRSFAKICPLPEP